MLEGISDARSADHMDILGNKMLLKCIYSILKTIKKWQNLLLIDLSSDVQMVKSNIFLVLTEISVVKSSFDLLISLPNKGSPNKIIVEFHQQKYWRSRLLFLSLDIMLSLSYTQTIWSIWSSFISNLTSMTSWQRQGDNCNPFVAVSDIIQRPILAHISKLAVGKQAQEKTHFLTLLNFTVQYSQ